jgi:hypothetical protein
MKHLIEVIIIAGIIIKINHCFKESYLRPPSLQGRGGNNHCGNLRQPVWQQLFCLLTLALKVLLILEVFLPTNQKVLFVYSSVFLAGNNNF